MKPYFKNNDVEAGGLNAWAGRTVRSGRFSYQKFDGLNTQDRPPSTKLNLPSGELPFTFRFSSVYSRVSFSIQRVPKRNQILEYPGILNPSVDCWSLYSRVRERWGLSYCNSLMDWCEYMLRLNSSIWNVQCVLCTLKLIRKNDALLIVGKHACFR